jgi:hypothetical protein
MKKISEDTLVMVKVGGEIGVGRVRYQNAAGVMVDCYYPRVAGYFEPDKVTQVTPKLIHKFANGEKQ